MSLNWTITECTESSESLWDGDDGTFVDGISTPCSRDVTDSIIWGTLTVGLPGVKNAAAVDEWVWRLAYAEMTRLQTPSIPVHRKAAHGPLQVVNGIKYDAAGDVVTTDWATGDEWVAAYRFLNAADLTRRIGLTTNVTPQTRKQWLTAITKTTARRVDDVVRLRAMKEVEA